MITRLAQQLSKQENYKILSGSIIPRPVAFVTTMEEEHGIINAAPFSFFNVVSSDPPCLMLSVGRKQGEMKDTARNAVAFQELVIHLTTEAIVEEVNKTAAPLASSISELSLTELQTVPSQLVKVPGIADALMRMECQLMQHIPVHNDAGEITTDLFLCRVLCYHLHEDVYDPVSGYVNDERIQAVARLAGNFYAKLGDRFTLERPL